MPLLPVAPTVAIHGQDSQKQSLAPGAAATEHVIMILQPLKLKPQIPKPFQPDYSTYLGCMLFVAGGFSGYLFMLSCGNEK